MLEWFGLSFVVSKPSYGCKTIEYCWAISFLLFVWLNGEQYNGSTGGLHRGLLSIPFPFYSSVLLVEAVGSLGHGLLERTSSYPLSMRVSHGWLN